MTNDESDKEQSFAEIMTGVKKFSDDRVNTYRDRIKNTPQAKQKTQDQESNLDFSSLSFQHRSEIRDAHFDKGIQKKLQRKILDPGSQWACQG